MNVSGDLVIVFVQYVLVEPNDFATLSFSVRSVKRNGEEAKECNSDRSNELSDAPSARSHNRFSIAGEV